MRVGLLALQGGYALHETMCRRLRQETARITRPEQLDAVDALILPGGESTAMLTILKSGRWFRELKRFVLQKPVFGTCAGAILLSQAVEQERLETLQAIGIRVERNAYGRQIDSFTAEVGATLGHSEALLACTFIRAPRITACSPQVAVLARYRGSPILVQEGRILAATFHPELSDETRVHEHFFSAVCPA